MKTTFVVLAALAAMGFAGGAYAKDAKPTGPTLMTDSEMDNVTAGLAVTPPFGTSGCNGTPLCADFQPTGGVPSGNAFSNPGSATGAATFP